MKLLSEKVRSATCGLLAAMLLFVSGCASTPDPIFTSEPALDQVTSPVGAGTNAGPSSTGEGVRFQIGDQLTITFSDTPDQLLPHEERIKEDGNITLPLIGAVKAVGKSPGQLQKEIKDLYVPKYYVRLTVTVKWQGQELAYSVLGEVRGPGPKAYVGVTTVTKAIGAAGGLTDFANESNIVLTRANGTQLKINYKKAIKDPKLDPQVFPGDSINVPKSRW